MTGSAINIVAGQVPALMGITGFSTRAATYEVIINTLKGLPRTTIDAAWGLTGLFSLYAIHINCNQLSKRYPRRARLFFFISITRNAFVVIVLTFASWLYCRHRKPPPVNIRLPSWKLFPQDFKTWVSLSSIASSSKPSGHRSLSPP
ncbi:hypothetical protein C8R48DRAFT_791280 [Suillus tomentosus]|nr:hypothetical protein C8R48DRAFT_791280 [Suillus tomentosus]